MDVSTTTASVVTSTTNTFTATSAAATATATATPTATTHKTSAPTHGAAASGSVDLFVAFRGSISKCVAAGCRETLGPRGGQSC